MVNPYRLLISIKLESNLSKEPYLEVTQKWLFAEHFFGEFQITAQDEMELEPERTKWIDHLSESLVEFRRSV